MRDLDNHLLLIMHLQVYFTSCCFSLSVSSYFVLIGKEWPSFVPDWIETVVSSVFNNSLTHSPFRVTVKLQSKSLKLQLFRFGNSKICLLSLTGFKVFILRIATTACLGCNYIFLSKIVVILFSLVIIVFTGRLTDFLSGFLILISPLLGSIITSKLLTKSCTWMIRSETYRFSTTRKLIHRLRPPIWTTVFGVLPVM